MSLDPEIAAVLEHIPPLRFSELSIDELRAAVNQGFQAMPKSDLELASVEDRSIPGPAGQIGVRIYKPIGDEMFPLLLFTHSGGFIMGDLDSSDGLCRALCHGSRCIVVSVDYRLAPEHRFPAAHEDSYAALLWVAENAKALGGDVTRIAVGGDSAGGALAAISAIRARDERGPDLCAQLLMYPGTDYPDSERYHSLIENAQAPLVWTSDVHYSWDQYLGDPRKFIGNWRVWPRAAASHADLPPAFVAACEFDPIRDDTKGYADALKAAGTPVEFRCFEGMPHGFYAWAAFSKSVRVALQETCTWLSQRFEAKRQD